eukprot:PhM_4_TR13205/c0_g1_i1/m.53111
MSASSRWRRSCSTCPSFSRRRSFNAASVPPGLADAVLSLLVSMSVRCDLVAASRSFFTSFWSRMSSDSHSRRCACSSLICCFKQRASVSAASAFSRKSLHSSCDRFRFLAMASISLRIVATESRSLLVSSPDATFCRWISHSSRASLSDCAFMAFISTSRSWNVNRIASVCAWALATSVWSRSFSTISCSLRNFCSSVQRSASSIQRSASCMDSFTDDVSRCAADSSWRSCSIWPLRSAMCAWSTSYASRMTAAWRPYSSRRMISCRVSIFSAWTSSHTTTNRSTERARYSSTCSAVSIGSIGRSSSLSWWRCC